LALCIACIGILQRGSEGNASLGHRREQRLVQEFLSEVPLKLSTKAFRIGFPVRWCAIPRGFDQASIGLRCW
jgi:hypothetical protein